MCKTCGTNCRERGSRRFALLAAALVSLVPGAMDAVYGYADSEARTNKAMDDMDARGEEITDEFLKASAEKESDLLDRIYKSVPIPALEEAALQLKGIAADAEEIGGSFKAFIRQAYVNGDRTMSEEAQHGIQDAIDYEQNVESAASGMAELIIGALGGRKQVRRDPDGNPIMPGSPAGVTS